MADGREVITIADDSDDENYKVHSQKRKVTKLQNGEDNKKRDVVDLCESDGGDENVDRNASTVASTGTSSPSILNNSARKRKRRKKNTNEYSSNKNFTSESAKSPDVAAARRRTTTPTLPRVNKYTAVVSEGNKQREKRPNNRRNDSMIDSESDSDFEFPVGPIFSKKNGKTKEKEPPNKTGNAEASCVTIDDDNYEPATSTFVSPQRPKKRVVYNPYAKTPPRPTTTTPASMTQSRTANNDSDSDLEFPPVVFTNSSQQARAQQRNTPINNSPIQMGTVDASTQVTTRQSIRPLAYPTLLTNSIQYPDLRAKYAIALWRISRSQLQIRAHERTRLDQVMKKVVLLALSKFPLRSLDEYLSARRSTGHASAQQKEQFERLLIGGGVDHIVTPPSRYGDGFYTITEACLVSLYDHVRHRRSVQNGEISLSDHLKEPESWMSLNDMIPAVDSRLRQQCPARLQRPLEEDNGVAHYLDPSTRSPQLMQITKLECELGDGCGPRIKRHRRGGRLHWELLETGYHDAERIKNRSFPSPPGHYRCSKILEGSSPEQEYEDICLGVDRQEGGGGARCLHEMCNKLDMCKVPFFVGTLAIGDYVFFARKERGGRMDYLCPIIVERKAFQDVAHSIHDGRWKQQKSRMYKGQYIFGYNQCRMVYIIEGNENKHLVSGEYVGNRFYNIQKSKVLDEIDNLREEGFEVIRTPSRENTMFELARWAKRVAQDIKNGKLTLRFTYQEFKQELQSIPRQVDFSRLAKDHTARKLERERQEQDDANTDAIETEQATEKKMTEQEEKYEGYSLKRLRELCQEVGLPKTGSRSDLIARYCGPHPPRLWLERKRRREYVPARYNVAGSALLVALFLHEKKTGGLDNGLTKDELYMKAENLNITKNPFSGGTTQTGPYHYDGWSSMSALLKGDPALVKMSKGRYKLTRSGRHSGAPIAEEMHKWCHQHNNCSCGEVFDT